MPYSNLAHITAQARRYGTINVESRFRSGDARQLRSAPVPKIRLSSPSNPVFSATVVICTRDRAHELGDCLQAVARLRYPRFEVLVVENGPPDARTQGVAEWHGARYLNCPRLGLSRARNAGARACHTDLVAYLDDDARPHPDWLAALACEFADPLVMAVGGEELRPISQCEMERLAAQPAHCAGGKRRPARNIGPDTREWFALTNFGGCGCGCSMAFRRAAFDVWRGFDERLGRGAPLDSAEETRAFFELVECGYRCVHTPDAVVWHPGPQSPEEWRRFNLHNMTNAIAYAALLWYEFPRFRRQLLLYLLRRNSSNRRRARAESGVPQLSLREKLRVIAGGLRLYSRIPRPSRPAAPIAVPARKAFGAPNARTK